MIYGHRLDKRASYTALLSFRPPPATTNSARHTTRHYHSRPHRDPETRSLPTMGNILSRVNPDAPPPSCANDEDEINALYAQAATLIEAAESKAHQRDVRAAQQRGYEPPSEECKTCAIRVLFCADCGREVYCHRGWCSHVEIHRRLTANAPLGDLGVREGAHPVRARGTGRGESTTAVGEPKGRRAHKDEDGGS